MLLNHFPGIPEYNFSPAYVSYLLQHPDHIFSRKITLNTSTASRSTSSPAAAIPIAIPAGTGTDDGCLTGDHARFITETIFLPLGLDKYLHRSQPGYLNYPELVNAWDRYSDGVLENASQAA